MPTLKFAVLAGDYIGPEVMTEALRVLLRRGLLLACLSRTAAATLEQRWVVGFHELVATL